jgi:hypothetical protein
MLDLHPVTEEHVEDAHGRHVGVIADPEYADEDLPNAEARLEEAVVAGLYVFEAEVEFDVLQHYDNADELMEAKAERLDSQQELVQQIRSATPPLRLREHVVLRRYHAA